MIRSTVTLTDRFPEITTEIRRRTIAALDAAAVAGAQEGDRRANTPKPIARFTVIPAHPTHEGFAAGVKVGPLARIFDKGSLGKRRGALKRDRRQPEWEVNRGANPYTARRHSDLEGKGVAPRHIFNAARTAGRKQLLNRLLSR